MNRKYRYLPVYAAEKGPHDFMQRKFGTLLNSILLVNFRGDATTSTWLGDDSVQWAHVKNNSIASTKIASDLLECIDRGA